MNDKREDRTIESGDAIEALLARATPRPVPPEADARMIRAAVESEWRSMTNRRRTRLRWVQVAAAASVVLAVLVTLNFTGNGNVEPVTVAEIGKRFGSIYVLGDNAELLEGNNLSTVTVGQTLVTDRDSGIALAWSTGGSLRIDENSRIEFLDRHRVYLRSGRVYFDSAPRLAAAASVSGSDAMMTINTDFGEVRHVGTQFMAAAGGGQLIVSVREGEVMVESAGRRTPAAEGQQLAISGSGAFDVVNIGSHGGAWTWVERTAPGASLDGRTVLDLLEWISRETGLALEFRSQQARLGAEQSVLYGQLDLPPRQALEVWMPGTDLAWWIENGVIYVGEDD